MNFEGFIKSFSKIKPLSNFDINNLCKKLKSFKGTYMRDELKSLKRSESESLIINYDLSKNSGTHWVLLFIKNKECIYFDSFGLTPPPEVEQYCSGLSSRQYNSLPIQEPDSVLCGHYCVYVAWKLDSGEDFFTITDELYRFKK
jgi:hypothetical protein